MQQARSGLFAVNRIAAAPSSMVRKLSVAKVSLRVSTAAITVLDVSAGHIQEQSRVR